MKADVSASCVEFIRQSCTASLEVRTGRYWANRKPLLSRFLGSYYFGSYPKCNFFFAKSIGKFRLLLIVGKNCCGESWASSSILRSGWGAKGIPPSPWFCRIIELVENRKVIDGLQSLAGKILSHLGLQLKICPNAAVVVFTLHGFRCGDDLLIRFWVQGQMSHRAVDFVGATLGTG